NRRLISLFSFFEVRRWFKSTDDRKPFCLLTIGTSAGDATFAFDLRTIDELRLEARRFMLSAEDIGRINPNTRTAPVFRSRFDAELTAKIYARAPVLIDEASGGGSNLWDLSFLAMFHMSNDSGLFRTAAELRQAGFVREGSSWTIPKGRTARQRALPL